MEVCCTAVLGTVCAHQSIGGEVLSRLRPDRDRKVDPAKTNITKKG